jgi:hypothetical protein
MSNLLVLLTLALVNQILDRDTIQSSVAGLDKGEHFAHGFVPLAVGCSDCRRSFFTPESLQSLAYYFLNATEVAGL